jgi:tetratricopeptide (TPR) repeat protein
MRTWLVVCMIVLSVAGCESKREAKTSAQDPALVKQASAKLMQQGVQFLNARDIPKAVVSFQGAIQVNPKDLQPYMVLAEIFLRLKSYPDAINVLERAANIFPDNGFVFYMLSIANQESGNPLPAVLAARRSAELFKAQNNEEGYQRSVVMMEALIKSQQQLQLQQEQKETPIPVSGSKAAPSAAASNPVGKK